MEHSYTLMITSDALSRGEFIEDCISELQNIRFEENYDFSVENEDFCFKVIKNN